MLDLNMQWIIINNTRKLQIVNNVCILFTFQCNILNLGRKTPLMLLDIVPLQGSNFNFFTEKRAKEKKPTTYHEPKDFKFGISLGEAHLIFP